MTQTELVTETVALSETPHPNREFINGLRGLADFLEAHPQAYFSSIDVNIFPQTNDDLAAAIRGIGGVKKDVTDSWFYFEKRFGPYVKLSWNRPREEVCRRVVKGKKIIPARPETVLPATPEREEEIVEWECPESILRSVQTEAALRG